MTIDLDVSLFADQAVRSLGRGDVLFRQGSIARAVYCLDSGQVSMVRHTIDGHRVTLHVVQAGEIFAEASLFSRVYRCDAVANKPSVVRALRKDVLRRRLATEPEITLRLLQRVAQQLHRARTLLELRNIRSADERVMSHLRLLSAESGDRRMPVEIKQPLIQIASDLGLTHEAYYRAIASLETKGQIVREGRRAFRLRTRAARG